MFRRITNPINRSMKFRRNFGDFKNFKNNEDVKVNSTFLITSLIFTGLSYKLINSQKRVEIIKINWIDLKKLLLEDTISKIKIVNNKRAIINTSDDSKEYILEVGNSDSLEKKIEKVNENIIVEYENPSDLQLFLSTFIPSFLFFSLFLLFSRRQQGGLLNLFKNESKIIEEKTGVKLKDIAGLHNSKKDVIEFANIVMNPDKYSKMGTKIPKGLLMEGPPGTGKTMLAKAIADNFDSKFYLLNGSDFIQPIVGTGSRKVKDLFETVRENSRAIIFIDEIDAIGKSRSNGKSFGNDERDNILNSLLVEMDGFQDNNEILVIGATNRVDILDSALIRPGRFDRVVKFDLPNLEERIDIMEVYYDKYKVDHKINKYDLFKKLRMLTYGFNGSQISNLYNEASICAVRNNEEFIKEEHFDKAIDFILLGDEKKDFINEKEKEIIAYHESGHALISSLLDTVPSPSKVSIIPRTKGMLGFSQSIPDYDKKLYNREELVSQMMVLMGGRAAEELVFNTVTNGASDDIDRINKIAREIIMKFGMGNSIGLRSISSDNSNNFWKLESESLIELADSEINDLIDSTYKITYEMLKDNYNKLVQIKNILYEKETIYKIDIENILIKKF